MKYLLRDSGETKTAYNRSSRLSRVTQNAGLLLAASALTGFAAWLAFAAACLYSRDIPLCRHPAGGWIILIGAMALVWLTVAAALRDKLMRRLRRGMYAHRPATAAWRVCMPATLRNVARLAWEGELQEHTWHAGRVHPALYDDRRGWWIATPIDDGTTVWVGRQTFYEWLRDVEGLHRGDALKPGESPIGQRLWEGRGVRRALWWAYCMLLEEAGAAYCATAGRNSRRLVEPARFNVIGILEILEDLRPVEEN